ncbi:MAG TPA: hypothetical protein VGR02_20430 [Thermoanaerobaculia bacterium]|jgi:hypothetical protein|nr:hypothetical protein [Thermoanaerobaculia bacterium]
MRFATVVLCLVTVSAFAETPASDATKTPPLTVCEVRLDPKPTKTPDEAKKEAARQAQLRASLGDSIIIALNPAELTAFLDFAARQDKAVTLYLNGNDTGIAPEAIDRPGGRLQFHLERTTANKAVWSALLRHPFLYQVRRVKAGVGIAPAPAAVSSEFHLVVVKWAWYAWAWLVVLLLVLVAFGYLTREKGLLRDVTGGPYSLGRCQMAWWFFLIITSYVLIWLISGDRDTIPASLLGLMGISAGTALGAVLIEATSAGSNSLQQASADALALEVAEKNAQKDVDTAQAAVIANAADAVAQKQLQDARAALTAVQSRLADARKRLTGATAPPKSNGFVRDILGDSEGNVGLHRFQMVLWTLVLGIMFVVAVVAELTMPEFNTTLLATMGISAGTYLGFKFPEK